MSGDSAPTTFKPYDVEALGLTPRYSAQHSLRPEVRDDLPAGVKRTTGNFDPYHSPIYFLASNLSTAQVALNINRYILLPMEKLTGGEQTTFLLRRLREAGTDVLLDSGIFALTNDHKRKHGCTMDEALRLPPTEIDGFDKLWDKYAHYVRRYQDIFWGIIELDQGGAANKRVTRARIEQELGIVPIPVYHPFLDGWDYFDELAQSYDRICFGNIVQARRDVRLRLIHTAYDRARQYPYLWIHILGLSANELVLSIPPQGSCDSSTWVSLVRYPDNQGSTAMMKKLGLMPRGFAYQRGDQTDHARAYCFGGAQGFFTSATWQHHTRRLEELGLR